MLTEAARKHLPLRRAVLHAYAQQYIPSGMSEEAGELKAAALYSAVRAPKEPILVCQSFTFKHALAVVGLGDIANVQLFGLVNNTKDDADNRSYVAYELLRLLFAASQTLTATVPVIHKMASQDRFSGSEEVLTHKIYQLSFGFDSVGTAEVLTSRRDGPKTLRTLIFSQDTWLAPADLDVLVGY